MGHLITGRYSAWRRRRTAALPLVALFAVLAGCSGKLPVADVADTVESQYKIGPGDVLDVFVWRNPDLTVAGVPVRPDGGLSIPLVEDVVANGKTPTELGNDIKTVLATYIKDPLVTITVRQFSGEYGDRVRVIGEATTPAALPYRNGMRLLDLVTAVGGLTEYAAGDKAFILRGGDQQRSRVPVKLDKLINSGDLSLDVALQPGDVLVIPEAWF